MMMMLLGIVTATNCQQSGRQKLFLFQGTSLFRK